MQVLTPSSRRRAKDLRLFTFIYAMTFPVFLLWSLARRLLPVRSPSRSGSAPRDLTVIQEARASAETCGSFALMG